MNFQESYNRKSFINFLTTHYFFKNEEKKLKIQNNDLILSVVIIGYLDFDKKVPVLEVEHNLAKDKRVTLTKKIFSLVNSFSLEQVLVIFYSKKAINFRLSLIESNLIWSSNNQVKKVFSQPKRLSFLLGKNEKTHTPSKQLIKKIKNYNDLKNAFDIEIVTKEFFNNYKKLYQKILDIFLSDKDLQKSLNQNSDNTVLLSKKLLAQIIFCYFLQKKGWLGIKNNQSYGDGDKNFLRSQFSNCINENKNFFNDYLEYFFYDGLDSFDETILNNKFGFKMPYLNGGLFENILNYDWKNSFLNIPNDIFSNNNNDGILDIFDLYNFTIDEEDDFDKDISIDPEMLGKVFESLLDENIRKEKGAFYTPREVVKYMCRKSIYFYLKKKIGNTAYKKILILIVFNYKNFDEDYIKKNPIQIDQHLLEKIDNYLKIIKVCDPAIGSGAFPVGMMNEISNIRYSIQVYKERKKNKIFFKKYFIENSLFGVDLDPSAIEIAKIRLWLALIIDEKNYSNENTLPHLEFKLIQGNSLIHDTDGLNFNLPKQNEAIQLNLTENNNQLDFNSAINEYEKLLSLFYNNNNKKKEEKIKNQIEVCLNKIINSQKKIFTGSEATKLDFRKKKNYFMWKLFFSNIFYKNNGFDIVICNPPYNKERDNKSIFQEVYEGSWGKKYHMGKMDFWNFFLHLAIDISNDNPIITFITSKYWINSSGAKKLIKRVEKELFFLEVIDFGKLDVFDDVAGHHMIHFYAKKNNNISNKFNYKKILKNINEIEQFNLNNEVKNSKDIFQKNEINFRTKVMVLSNTIELEENFLVSQGIVQNPDKVNKKNSEKYNLKLNEGVFVIEKNKLKELKLCSNEMKFIKPFYNEKDIKNYNLNKEVNNYLIYLTPENCQNIDELPNLKKHLIKFRTIMDGRRENVLRRRNFYHLHWGRNEKFFCDKKILFPSMFKSPQLTFNNFPAYVGMGCNVIIEKTNTHKLEFLFSILISDFAKKWYESNCKERGSGFDLSVKKLNAFPVKIPNEDLENKIIKNILSFIKITNNNSNYLELSSDQINLIKKNNSLISELYNN